MLSLHRLDKLPGLDAVAVREEAAADIGTQIELNIEIRRVGFEHREKAGQTCAANMCCAANGRSSRGPIIRQVLRTPSLCTEQRRGTRMSLPLRGASLDTYGVRARDVEDEDKSIGLWN